MRALRLSVSLLLAALAAGVTTAASACGAGCASHFFVTRTTASNAAPLLSAARRRAASGELGPHARRAAPVLAPSESVSMSATVGWNGRYRALGAWVPLRVTIRNNESTIVSGSLNVATSSVTDPLENRPARDALYQANIQVLAHAVRRVTIYVPGRALPDRLAVVFRVGRASVASDTLFPVPIDDRDITLGVLTADVASVAWVERVRVAGAATDVIRIGPDDLEQAPEALAAFDAIIVTNVNSALLDQAQRSALERYVRSGGTLIAVGGPDWQETLRPLPPDLIPGHLAGTTVIRGLPGLGPFQQGEPPLTSVTVSILDRPLGSSIGGGQGVSLVVRSRLGVGRLEYLAFDPALEPTAHWTPASMLLTRLVTGVMPQAMRRLALPSGFDVLSFRDPGPASVDPADGAVPVARTTRPALPVRLPLALAVALLYILIAGPLGYLGLRRLRRPAAGWLAPPAMAIGVSGLLLAAAPHHHSAPAVLGSVGSIMMDGGGADYSADTYVRVLSLASSDHVLTTPPNALAAAIPAGGVTAAPRSGVTGAQWVFRQGADAGVTLPSLAAGRSRVFDLHAVAHVAGGINESLRIDAGGAIVGTIHNATRLHILHPAVVAGDAFERLPDLGPGVTVAVRLRPEVNVLDNRYRQILNRVYEGIRDPAGQPLSDALNVLPEAGVATMLSQVFLVGWNDQALVSLTLDGGSPVRRDLTLIVKPLAVDFPHGAFRLRSGTLGAYPLDIVPVTPQYACCPPTVQGIFLGAGGSATFEFDLPRRSGIHARSLFLSAFAGGADTTYTGYADMPPHATSVFDWRAGRWLDLAFRHGISALPHPDSLFSPSGALLVRIRASAQSGDLAVIDPHHDLQLSGTLTAR